MKKIPRYFSNNLTFSINNKKGICTDRIKLRSIFLSLIISLLLAALGLYDLSNGFGNTQITLRMGTDNIPDEQIASTAFFDLCFVAIGCLVFANKMMRFLRYNKYKIDNETITIIKRRLFHGKKQFNESLNNYEGVRFRVEFFQIGIIAKNRYVVELLNKNPERSVPLYLSTSNRGVRQKLKEYAKLFKLPIIENTDDGIKYVDYKDMDKSLIELNKHGTLVDTYDEYERLPKLLVYVRKKDKIVIKIKKLLWDAYNAISWLVVCLSGILAISGITTIIFSQHLILTAYLLTALSLAVMVVLLHVLFRKEKLVIKRHKIVHTYKYLLFSTKHNQIMKNEIEAVEIEKNPANERYYVAIISNNNTIAFGAKLKIKDLRWLKRFLIHEIIC